MFHFFWILVFLKTLSPKNYPIENLNQVLTTLNELQEEKANLMFYSNFSYSDILNISNEIIIPSNKNIAFMFSI